MLDNVGWALAQQILFHSCPTVLCWAKAQPPSLAIVFSVHSLKVVYALTTPGPAHQLPALIHQWQQ